MKVFDAHCHIYPAKIARKAAQTHHRAFLKRI